ncbi:DUF485 domain-containing protein [Sphaerisporangium sp. NPDC005288]|uniref:DUF485 domain-containing protein n=1 Tax=unclassified Sphaerisporangium TaxID=2630420 RepID=UPI0033A1A2F2
MTTRQDESSEYEQVQAGADFQELRRRYRSWAFPVTIAFLAWYLLYVILSGWARGFMGTKVFGNVNVALIFGVLQFVSTFLIAWAYARHADKKLDPLSGKLRDEMETTTHE